MKKYLDCSSVVRITVGVGLGMLLLVNTGLTYRAAVYNMDLVVYLGVVEVIQGADHSEAHRRAYQQIIEGAPHAEAAALVGSTPFRVQVYEDPEAFSQQLVYCQVKPLYPIAIAMFSRLGISNIEAAILVQNLAYLMIGVVTFLWLQKRMNPWMAGIFTYGIASVQVLMRSARYSTPDTLAALLVLIAAFLVIFGRSKAAVFFVSVLIILARPDCIIIALPLVVLSVPNPGRSWKTTVALALGLIAIGVCVQSYVGYYPWSTLFYSATVAYVPYPANFESPLKIVDYLRIYIGSGIYQLFSGNIVLYFFAGVLGIFVRWGNNLAGLAGDSRRLSSQRNSGQIYGQDRVTWVLVAAVLFLPLKFLVFPIEGYRHLLSAYVLILVIVAHTAGDLYSCSHETAMNGNDVPTQGAA